MRNTDKSRQSRGKWPRFVQTGSKTLRYKPVQSSVHFKVGNANVRLISCGNDKPQVIATIMSVARCSVDRARMIVDSAPAAVFENNVGFSYAQNAARRLSNVGATVQLYFLADTRRVSDAHAFPSSAKAVWKFTSHPNMRVGDLVAVQSYSGADVDSSPDVPDLSRGIGDQDPKAIDQDVERVHDADEENSLELSHEQLVDVLVSVLQDTNRDLIDAVNTLETTLAMWDESK